MTVASSSAEVEAKEGRFIPIFGTPLAASLPARTATSPSRSSARSVSRRTTWPRTFVANTMVTPSAVKSIVLRADDTGVHDQRVDGSVDGRQPGADRVQIGDVHDNDVEDAPAGRRFKFGLRRCRPVLGSGTPGRSRAISGRSASCRATSLPIPALAPVINTVLPSTSAIRLRRPLRIGMGCVTHSDASEHWVVKLKIASIGTWSTRRMTGRGSPPRGHAPGLGLWRRPPASSMSAGWLAPPWTTSRWRRKSAARRCTTTSPTRTSSCRRSSTTKPTPSSITTGRPSAARRESRHGGTW